MSDKMFTACFASHNISINSTDYNEKRLKRSGWTYGGDAEFYKSFVTEAEAKKGLIEHIDEEIARLEAAKKKLCGMDQIEQDRIQSLIASGHLGPNLAPIVCTLCGSADLTNQVKSMDGGIVSESECSCNKCGRMLGYWAYGHWQV